MQKFLSWEKHFQKRLEQDWKLFDLILKSSFVIVTNFNKSFIVEYLIFLPLFYWTPCTVETYVPIFEHICCRYLCVVHLMNSYLYEPQIQDASPGGADGIERKWKIVRPLYPLWGGGLQWPSTNGGNRNCYLDVRHFLRFKLWMCVRKSKRVWGRIEGCVMGMWAFEGKLLGCVRHSVTRFGKISHL